jgi:hypothetical protein
LLSQSTRSRSKEADALNTAAPISRIRVEGTDLLCRAPLATFVAGAVLYPDWLGANPAEYITRSTGDWTPRFLLLGTAAGHQPCLCGRCTEFRDRASIQQVDGWQRYCGGQCCAMSSSCFRAANGRSSGWSNCPS